MAVELLDRAALAHKVIQLRRERGASRIDGSAFDDDALARAERELEALEDRDAEQSRRSSGAVTNAEAARVAAAWTTLDEAAVKYGAAIQRLDAQLAVLHTSIAELHGLAATMTKAANSIKPGIAPTMLGERDVAARIGRAIAQHLAKLPTTSPNSYGGFEWRSASVQADGSFADIELAALAKEIGGAKNPPKLQPYVAPKIPPVEATENDGAIL